MRLIELLPDFYEQNITMQTLQDILSVESNRLDEVLHAMISECSASTAGSVLSRYEQLLDLDVDINKSDAYRQERIAAKISGAGTSTKEMIGGVARSYSNGDIEVIEDNSQYKFTVRFIGILGIPGNMADLKLSIEEIKPAHLLVEYEYIYNTWVDIGKTTWGWAVEHTWVSIREVRIS